MWVLTIRTSLPNHIILQEHSVKIVKDLYTDEGLELAGLKECKFRIDGD